MGRGGTDASGGWTEGSVSALRLPDAPNIMFNDINFLLNGPRFDSRCERGATPALPPFSLNRRRGSRKKYTRENNLVSRVREERKKEEAKREEEDRGIESEGW